MNTLERLCAVTALLGALPGLAALGAQQDALLEYTDPAGRFRFRYPASFGSISEGTNNGFGDRVAAMRFSGFSSEAIGGEAALTRGVPAIDLQAVGGLYDAIVLELFPESIRTAIVGALPRLTAGNFCRLFAQERHVDPGLPAFSALSAAQRDTITSSDRMRNVAPRVIRCDAQDDVVTFHKEVAFEDKGPRQHVYGAVRFLPAPYSTFQIVRAGPSPAPALLDSLSAVAASWTAR